MPSIGEMEMELELKIIRYSEIIYNVLLNLIGNEELVRLNRLCSEPAIHVTDPKAALEQQFKRISDSCLNGMLTEEMLTFFNAFTRGIKGSIPIITSGSRAEGFNFQSSDFDMMIVSNMVNLIQNPSQQRRRDSQLLLFTETENTRPGFVRLKLLHDFGPVNRFFTKLGPNFYLSNSKFKQYCLRINKIFGMSSTCNIHGPCLSFLDGNIDLAVALSSNTWARDAIGCIHRMIKRRWPSDEVISEMIKDGCLFVPIGCRSSPHEEIEWRISFSLAEKRLVRSMNHMQFLTYGLLKLLLRDTIEANTSVKDLLCSYFMKTLVFWEIIETDISWNPSHLLQHFWNCFRRLMSWVNNGYCPNFFIPENNMFYQRIHGRSREKLLRFLGVLHRDGYLMLHRITSFQYQLDNWRAFPRQNIIHGLRKSIVIQKLLLSLGFIRCQNPSSEIYKLLQSSKSNIVLEFCHLLRLSKLNISCCRKLFDQISNVCSNNVNYSTERALLRLIKASSPDYVRSKLFLAMYFYKCQRLDRSICLLHKVINKLYDFDTMYVWAFDADKFSSFGGDMLSVFDSMYEYTASCVPLDSKVCIPEISKECRCPHLVIGFHLIPPLVLTHFLLILCHFWRGELRQAREHLTDLYYCLQYNDGYHIFKTAEAISWEMLGIAQEIMGDFRHALKSFRRCKRYLRDTDQYFNECLFKANKERIVQIKTFLNIGRI